MMLAEVRESDPWAMNLWKLVDMKETVGAPLEIGTTALNEQTG